MSVCENCNQKFEQLSTSCDYCHFPLQGNENEKNIFYAQQAINEGKVKTSIINIRKARNLLFIFAGINFFILIRLYMLQNSSLVLSINLLIVIFFLAGAFLCIKYPIPVLSTILFILLTYYIYTFLIIPISTISTILWRLAVLGFLSYNLIEIIKANKTLKNNLYLAEKMGYNAIGNKKQNSETILDL